MNHKHVISLNYFWNSLSEVRWTGFPVSQPATYEFAPFAATRDLATRHVSDSATGPRVWYDYAPSAGSALPLVILLHGAERDGLSLIEMWSETAKRHGIALLVPDARGAVGP